MKKIFLILLLSLGLIGISYADDSQAAIEKEIAEFEAELALALIPLSGKFWTCNRSIYKQSYGGLLCKRSNPSDPPRCWYCKEIIKALKQIKVVLEKKINEVEDDELKELKIEMIEQQIFEIEATIAEFEAEADFYNKIPCPDHWECKIGYERYNNSCRLKVEEVTYIDVEKTKKLTCVSGRSRALKLKAEIEAKRTNNLAAPIKNQEIILKNAWVNNIAAKVNSVWNFSEANSDWFVEVLVTQNREGKVLNITFGENNIGDSVIAKRFIDSIERAIYKASPLPIAPDASVWQKDIMFTFTP